MKNIYNLEDANTIYICQNDLKPILEELRYDMMMFIKMAQRILNKS